MAGCGDRSAICRFPGGARCSARDSAIGRTLPFKEELEFAIRCDAATAKLLEPMQPYFKQMANAKATQIGPMADAGRGGE